MAIDQSAIGMQRLANDQFGNVGSVGIGGVDKIDAELGQALQHPQRFGAIGRLAPDSAARDAHGAEAEAMHFQRAAD